MGVTQAPFCSQPLDPFFLKTRSLVGPKLVDKSLALRSEILALLCGGPGSPPGPHRRAALSLKTQVYPGPQILWAPPPTPHFVTPNPNP